MANKKISDYGTKTNAAATDLVLLQDVPASAYKQTTVAGLATAVASALPTSSIDSGPLAPGVSVQVASTNYSAVATGTALMSRADTVPTNTQGTEFMTQTITPKSAANTLIIEANVQLSSSAAGATDMIAALFQDGTVNAIAATYNVQAGTNYSQTLRLRHKMVAGTTSATTFKVRAGDASAGTTTFNGIASGRIFGGITVSNITVTEYKA